MIYLNSLAFRNVLSSIFNWNFIKIIVELHAIIRNNPDNLSYTLSGFPNGSILQNQIYFQSQDIDIYIINQRCSDFPSYTGTHLRVF